MVVAEWTGRYPCLCSGEWRLTIDGNDYSNFIPIEKRYGEMNTAGVYMEWHFEDWEEVFEDYEDGLEFEDWLRENEWVNRLPANPFDVYCAIQSQDWRHGSCGGCI